MTKKDYIIIAEEIKKAYIRPTYFQGEGINALNEAYQKGIRIVTENLAEQLAFDNPRFDRVKFYQACGLVH